MNREPTEHKHDMLHLPREELWSRTKCNTCYCRQNDAEKQEILLHLYHAKSTCVARSATLATRNDAETRRKYNTCQGKLQTRVRNAAPATQTQQRTNGAQARNTAPATRRAIAAIWRPTEGHTCHCTRNDTEQEGILHLPRQEHLGRTKRHTCHVT